MTKKHKNYDVVMEYAHSIVNKEKLANKETIEMCQRFLDDLENEEYDFKPKDAEFVIQIIEKTFVHDKGERLDGTPLRGQPFILEPWQKFIIYNLLGFFHKGTIMRRFKEAFIFLPRKNGKTRFVAALSWALALLERKSGSSIYIVGAALRQARQSFEFINFNLDKMGEADNFRIRDNNQESSIMGDLGDGSLHIEALAANPDKQDSLNCNIAIADELHSYRRATQYNVIKEAMKAYTNKLMIGITTAGDNANSFCYHRLKYCQKILNGSIKDEQYFVFIAKADESKDGEVDYTCAKEHEKANPNYGITIRSDDIMNDALQAQNDPQQRKDFLAKSINIYTSAMDAYFNIDEFQSSNEKAEKKLGLTGLTLDKKLKKLASLKLDWYGGVDLSKRHDLSSTAIYATYKDIDIALSHAFFPIVAAHEKANVDNIPLFGWESDGFLTMSNNPVVDYQDIVKWFLKMKKNGFNVKSTGVDKKFAREFLMDMKQSGFRTRDAPQYFHLKSEGFRRIESKAKEGKFYYLGSEALEYCVQNVRAIEQTDDAIRYEKILDSQRIDVFDACVFSCMEFLNNLERGNTASMWLNG